MFAQAVSLVAGFANIRNFYEFLHITIHIIAVVCAMLAFWLMAAHHNDSSEW
jgi:hypothetical protein